MPRLGSYGQLCTEFYELDKPDAPPAALEFYWCLYEAAGGPALELMCGSGRFLVPFAARGANIDGVDASPEMLTACRQRLAERGLIADVYEQLAEELALPGRYRFAFVPGGSLVLIPTDVQSQVLHRLAAHLEPGAVLAIEMHTPSEPNYFEASDQTKRRVTRTDGAEIVLSSQGGAHRYDLVQHGIVLRSEVETYGWHPRSRAEFIAMLEDAAFGEIQALKPYTEEPAGDSDGLIVYVCRRLNT